MEVLAFWQEWRQDEIPKKNGWTKTIDNAEISAKLSKIQYGKGRKREDMRRKEKHGREGDEGRSEEREDWERRECNSKRVRESEEGRDTCNMLCHVFATYTQDCTKPWQSQELWVPVALDTYGVVERKMHLPPEVLLETSASLDQPHQNRLDSTDASFH